MIESRQNKTVKDIRRIRRSKGDAAVLEGPHLVGEAVALGLPLSLVVVTPEFLDSAAGAALAQALPEPPIVVAAPILSDLADADSPRGVLAVAQLRRTGVDALPRQRGSTYCYLDGLQDPGNLGALVRVAEAAGALAMALSTECAHPNHPRALRASAGSLLRMPLAIDVDPSAFDRHLTGLAPRWIVLAPRGGESLYTANFDGTLVLALGAEGPGVSAQVLERATQTVTIPIEPPVESLNVTVAAALTLFEVRRWRSSGT